MHPLSIAASVAGLVAFGQQAIGFVDDLIKNAFEYPTEFGDFACELRSLCGLLTAIENEAESIKNNKGEFRDSTKCSYK